MYGRNASSAPSMGARISIQVHFEETQAETMRENTAIDPMPISSPFSPANMFVRLEAATTPIGTMTRG